LLKILPESAELTIISYYALSAGLLAGLASVLTGILEASPIMTQRGGIYEVDKKTIKAKVKTLFAHAVLNDIVLLVSAGYWWARRNSGGAAHMPETWMVSLGVALFGIQLFAAGLGGALAYGKDASIRIPKLEGKGQ
jgi:hypothetical protein